MLRSLRNRFKRAGAIADGAAFATDVLNRSGFLGALSPGGIYKFARAARGLKPGPHLGLLLHAINKPEKVGLIEGTTRMRFGEMNEQINQFSHALVSVGVQPGDRIAIMLPNSREYVIAQQALLRLGVTAVQVGYRLKAPEIAYILENSQPTAVLVHRNYLETMDKARKQAGGPDSSAVIVCRAKQGERLPSGQRYEDLVSSFNGSRMPDKADSDEAGVIVYTSGTTGKPKGANRSMKSTGLDAVGDFVSKVGMSHDDRHLVVCPLYHSAAPAFVAMMYSLGATVVVNDHFKADKVLELIERERITCAFMVPTMLRRMADLDEATRRKYDTSSLRWIMSGAAPLPTETAKRFQASFGHILYNFYGSTETGLVTLAEPEDPVSKPGTVGRLLRGDEVRLLDEHGDEVPVGEVGELYCRNSMIISGYHRNKEATDKSLRDGFFSVGDLARCDADGYYYMASRKHDMVISGGVNIYPREIEEYLHNHPDIVEAAVIGVPDDEWGESLKAFVVCRSGATLSLEQIASFCKEGLANYKQPRHVEFMTELPRNPTGKVLKRELRQRS